MSHRARIAAALAALVAIGVMPAARAAAAPAMVTAAEPQIGGVIQVERTAGETGGQPDGWRMNQDIWIQNTGMADLILKQVDVAYDGGSDPSDISVDVATFKTNTGFEVIQENTDEGWPANLIQPGVTRRVKVPEERVHAYPIADTVTVMITFDGFDPIQVTRDLAEYANDGPLGSLAFPGAAKDLAPGEYWTHVSGHQLRDHHRNQWWERHAEDWGVRRWDGSDWVTTTADNDLLTNADFNDDFLIWGKGLYVPIAGEVFKCANGHPDDAFKNEKVDGVGDYGNFVWIDTGTHRVLYSHIQNGTMPESICPADHSQVDQTPNPPVPVRAGQFVGRVGNSGNTTGPHLHIDIQSSGQGYPLLYHNALAASSKAFDPNNDPIPWNAVNGAAISMWDTNPGRGMLTLPNPRANVFGEIDGSPDPVIAGTQLTYDVTVGNHGPEAAGATTATVTIPPELEYVSDTGGCAEGPANVLTCGFNFGALGPNGEMDTDSFQVTADVPADLVHNHGSPVDVEASIDVTSAVFDDETAPATDTTTVIAVADLELVSTEVLSPPTELTIGEPETVTLREVLTNHGPSAPMDTRVDRTATPTTNAAVSPTATSHEEEALALDESRVIEEEFTVACEQPGPATFTFETQISPDRPDDTDPDPSNNSGMASFSVECIVPVAINIKPGSFTNPVNLKSKGVIPVAVLTTEAGEYGLPLAFDAATIQALSARFGPEGLVIAGGGAFEAHHLGHLEDARERSDEQTRDGDLDMVLHFRTQESGFGGTEVEACVRGLFGPMDHVFHGCDTVTLK